jgi:crotonobetainyl-CoA:carnitine CoA-transferase CaiB-like acyl-CoA transferase
MGEAKGQETGGHMKNLLPGCLHGVTVLDFTWVLAGPHGTKMLADMGATVIKIEQHPMGAIERYLSMRVVNDGVSQSSYSINVNRGKKSVCVNIKDPKGMAVIHDLIKKSDVIVENFSPGVMKRLQLDYDSVKKIKKDIVYCSISCFGKTGPKSHMAEYDMIAQGASGWTNQSEQIQIAPVSIGDTLAGIHAALAITSALYARQVQGIGQNIDIAMTDCLFSLHENTLPWYTLGQAIGKDIKVPKIGRVHPGYAPYGIFKGKDGYLCIAVLAANRWEPLVGVMGEKYAWLLSDPRSVSVEQRCANSTFVNGVIDEWVMSVDSVKEAERLLLEADVPCTRALSVEELADGDPQITAREMMPIVEQPFIGSIKMFGSPLKFSETPSCIRGHAPLIGEHNNHVLVDVLGFSEEQVKALYDANVVTHEAAVDRL